MRARLQERTPVAFFGKAAGDAAPQRGSGGTEEQHRETIPAATRSGKGRHEKDNVQGKSWNGRAVNFENTYSQAGNLL